MPSLAGFTLAAALCFIGLFFRSQTAMSGFWGGMAGQLFLLSGIGFLLSREKKKRFFPALGSQPLKSILIGLGSAIFLFLFFSVGREFLRLIWPESEQLIAGVYAFKQRLPGYFLGLLLGVIIGPGEEILWRWFLQEEWMKKLGPWSGWALVTGIYALVHLPTRNPVLVLAALSCGLFWGWLFLQFRSLLANIISHSLWDILVFVIFPLH